MGLGLLFRISLIGSSIVMEMLEIEKYIGDGYKTVLFPIQTLSVA